MNSLKVMHSLSLSTVDKSQQYSPVGDSAPSPRRRVMGLALSCLYMIIVLLAARFVPSGTTLPFGNNHTAASTLEEQAKAEVPRPPSPPAPTLVIGMVLPGSTLLGPIESLAVD